MTAAWSLAPGTHATVTECPEGNHREAGTSFSASWDGVADYAVVVCGDCSMARDMTDDELAKFAVGGGPLRRRVTP